MATATACPTISYIQFHLKHKASHIRRRRHIVDVDRLISIAVSCFMYSLYSHI